MITPKQERVMCCVDLTELKMPPLIGMSVWTECAKERAVAGGSKTACVRVGARLCAWKVIDEGVGGEGGYGRGASSESLNSTSDASVALKLHQDYQSVYAKRDSVPATPNTYSGIKLYIPYN